MEERVSRLEEDHRELDRDFRASEADRQRDLGKVYTLVAGMKGDLALIKWFGGVGGGAIIVGVITYVVNTIFGG